MVIQGVCRLCRTMGEERTNNENNKEGSLFNPSGQVVVT